LLRWKTADTVFVVLSFSFQVWRYFSPRSISKWLKWTELLRIGFIPWRVFTTRPESLPHRFKTLPSKVSFPSSWIHHSSDYAATFMCNALRCFASIQLASNCVSLLVSTVCMKDKIRNQLFFKILLFIDDVKHCVTFLSAALVKKSGKNLVTQY